MENKPLWKVSVRTTAETEDAVARVLEARFGERAFSYTNADTGDTRVSVFLKSRPAWSASRRALCAALQELAQCGLNAGALKASLVEVPPQNWAESWKRHFKPIEIGSRLLIKPSWSRRTGHRGQAVVVLDPGLSFGTGQHPTTGFCLRQLAACRHPRDPQSFLDVGTGSGILALAAARLGYRPVQAIDLDADALKVARANAALNRLTSRILFARQDVARQPDKPGRTFSLVCANLISNLLIEHRQKLAARVEPKGVLVVAGILRKEFGAVQRAYETLGWKLAASRAEGEWRSGAFRRTVAR